MTHVYYLSFYVLEAQKQLSWVVLAQGLSGGCSWEVGQGCNRPDQVCFLSRWLVHKYWLVETSGLGSSPRADWQPQDMAAASSQSEQVQEKPGNGAMYFMTQPQKSHVIISVTS